MGATSLAQSIGKTLPVEQAKLQKYALNSNAIQTPATMGTRAEGDPIWSDDFSEPTNWASTNTSAPPHGWTITTNLSAPPFAALAPVNFATGANGYAICDSDAAGTAANPSQTNATIVWSGAPIDCSDNPNVSLKFNTVTRNWSSTYFVRVSGDNGATWTEFPVLQHITTNTNTANSEVVSMNISSVAGGQSEVLIGFRYQAEWGWFWAIDDVELFETWNYDLVMNQTLNSVGSQRLKYTIYPVGQVVSDLRMGFGAQARNNGAMSMTPALRATQGIWSATGSQVTVNPIQNSDDSLSIADANGYLIPSTAGTYNIALDLVTEETVQNSAAVQKSMPFAVSPLIMAGDEYNGTPASMTGGFFGWATATGDPGIGREFEINSAGAIGRVAVGIANVAADNQGDYLGNEIYVELWKVVDGEAVFASISEPHIVVASNFGSLAQCYFEIPLTVNPGDIILAIAASGENNLVPVAFAGFQEAGTTVGKAGSEFVTLATDGDYVGTPVVRLDFGDYTGLTSNTLLSEDMAIYPNPADDNATVRFTLTEEANVSIVVRDLSGKMILAIESGMSGAGTYDKTIDLNTIAQGMYTVTLSANGAQVTQKLIKK